MRSSTVGGSLLLDAAYPLEIRVNGTGTPMNHPACYCMTHMTHRA